MVLVLLKRRIPSRWLKLIRTCTANTRAMAPTSGSHKVEAHRTHTVQKRTPLKSVPSSDKYIYISSSTNMYSLLKRVRRQLITQQADMVTICGMGRAVNKTSMLALQMQEMVGCRLVIRTGTVEMVDDLVPVDEDEDITAQSRRNSKIEVDLIGMKGK